MDAMTSSWWCISIPSPWSSLAHRNRYLVLSYQFPRRESPSRCRQLKRPLCTTTPRSISAPAQRSVQFYILPSTDIRFLRESPLLATRTSKTIKRLSYATHDFPWLRAHFSNGVVKESGGDGPDIKSSKPDSYSNSCTSKFGAGSCWSRPLGGDRGRSLCVGCQ